MCTVTSPSLQRIGEDRVDERAHGVERERLVAGVGTPLVLGDDEPLRARPYAPRLA